MGYENSANTLTWTINLTIPATAKAGTTRMRIGTSLGSMPNTPCGPNTYGEFEDYRLVIRDDATPPVITLKGKDRYTLINVRYMLTQAQWQLIM